MHDLMLKDNNSCVNLELNYDCENQIGWYLIFWFEVMNVWGLEYMLLRVTVCTTIF